MSESINRIRELDDEIFEQFKLYFPKIAGSNFVKQFPRTNLVLQLYGMSSNFIKNSIYDSCESDDYYGMKILFRSLTEHFLRFKYVFINFGSEKSDVFAQKYLDYNDAKEILDGLKARVSEQQLYDPDYKIADWDKFLEGHPRFNGLSRRQVEEEANKYTFKNIIRFLNNQFKTGDLDTIGFFGKLIIDYSSLSSFVHGGLLSYQEMISQTSESRTTEYNRICGLSFQMAATIKSFSLLLYYQYDHEIFGSHYLKIADIMKQLNR